MKLKAVPMERESPAPGFLVTVDRRNQRFLADPSVLVAANATAKSSIPGSPHPRATHELRHLTRPVGAELKRTGATRVTTLEVSVIRIVCAGGLRTGKSVGARPHLIVATFDTPPYRRRDLSDPRHSTSDRTDVTKSEAHRPSMRFSRQLL